MWCACCCDLACISTSSVSHKEEVVLLIIFLSGTLLFALLCLQSSARTHTHTYVHTVAFCSTFRESNFCRILPALPQVEN